MGKANANNNSDNLDPEAKAKLQQQAEELKEKVDANDFSGAMASINELTDIRDQSLYQEVGRLTRSLHESIRNFQIDTHKPDQHEALSKMSDASDRLKYVVDMTSKAANRTMDLVEEAMPRANTLKDQAGELHIEWQKLRRRELSAEQFRALYARLDTFLLHMVDESEFLYGNLSEILLAQDFQDLTGQTIQKVTTLVKEVEENLLSLVVMAGHVDQLTGTVHELDEQSTSIAKGEGPQMNAEEREDVVSGQDDVDDLLSSLGF